MRFEPISSAVVLILTAAAAGAAPPVIGTVTAPGSFRLDEATLSGNATLFEGSAVETRQARSSLDLLAGAHVLLAADSKGRVFGDHLILERGSAQIDRAAGFRLEARGLSIHAETGMSSARVMLAGSKSVRVAALSGSLRVLNGSGLLIASLANGAALEFDPQAAGEPWKMTGCLRAITGHFLLTDETTNVTVELAGGGIDKEAGNRVEITGALDPTATPVSGATQVIRVNQIRRVGRGCPATPGAAAAGAGGKPGGGKPGPLTTTTVAVIGGVAAAAVVGGLAAADALPGQGGTPVSR